jgi:hypothetical protein
MWSFFSIRLEQIYVGGAVVFIMKPLLPRRSLTHSHALGLPGVQYGGIGSPQCIPIIISTSRTHV